MRIISDTTLFRAGEGERLAVAIGKFDGVHLGHKKLLKEILAAKEDGFVPAVFTFDPDPMSLFTGRVIPQLTTRAEKRELLRNMGIEILIEFPMTKETAAIPPEQFVSEYLADRLHAGFVAAGTDLSFGYKGRGDYKLLKAMSAGCGFETCCIDKVMSGHREISSTYIREELEQGRIGSANALMGRPYSISGEVDSFPDNSSQDTASFVIIPPADKLLPMRGSYISRVNMNGETVIPETETVVGEKIMTKRTVPLSTSSNGKCLVITAKNKDQQERICGKTATVELLGSSGQEMPDK